VVLTAIFVACLLVSNLIAGRLIAIAGVALPAAVLIFPITYILGDVCTEVYGYRRARLVIWTGFAANCLMVTFALLTIAMPAPAFFEDQAAYATVLGQAPRMVLASLAAFWCGEFLNAFVLSVLKRATRGRHLWSRTIGSTLVGQAADTGIFLTVAFAGLIPWPVLVGMMGAQYLFKVGFEALCTPLTYAVVHWLKRVERVDAFDDGIRYNPFGGGTAWT
ncbi:MAG: queuosine precursor transporter, partial [Deltaproteobacteria bacterium]|nr:queuosine precursor transporter [Deltaproteobacteria bacterium]